ncbi:LOW QUALITY PROTEIN: uncharacterized protein LOC123503108 [Portunus trituberculatus]|uniref:LOW QUALITY PROTEIN: uncharacterized protein LOC123503108 n=1 Tax=Portunus trituberculatus TaxID=210409 RepID=UPI001E1CD0A4|nr:LOW QUALITY PROTEIN: uncharacterized protein LOC123503108 [Portunus trituberculatus]
METEVSRVEGEEEGENKGSTVQGKDEENKTPTGVESGKLCEKEQLETEGRNINMKKMSANIENDKTQKSLDKETEQSKKGDADTSRSKGWITTGDHDEPDKDAHDSGQPDMNEQSLKLTSEIRSKPNQGKTYTNMHEETLSEDVQNQTGANKITGKDVDQLKRLAVTKDVLNQADKHGIADKDVSEKANTTSQESTPEETPQNQKEEIGSESQEIEKNGIGYGSREDEKLSKEVMVQQNTTTSQLSKESEHPGGEISSKCDDSRTMKHKDVAPTCERKPSSSSSKNTVTDKKMPPKQKNIAKKSTSKKTPGGAVHKQQPSTEKTLSEEQDVGDSNDSDIVILSETIKTIENTDRSDQMSLVCQRCYYLWNDEVLEAIFEGNKSVTVNSKITYGAIMCFSNYADIHYPENKEKALRSVLERADLGKSIGNMKIKEVVVWLKCLMKSGSVSCCTVFDAVYNPKSADMMLSALLSPKPASQKENEVQKSKQPSTSMVDEETPKQKSSLTKTKHKAGPSSETITPSTNTTGAEKITLSQQSEVKKDPDTTAKSSVNTQVKELKAGLKKKDMHLSEAPATSYGDDSQSLNKKIIIKKCSVNLGKPVPITSKHRVRIYPVWKSSLKRSIIGEEVMRQSMKKRKNLGCKESTGTESLSESSDKNDAELPMNEPPTTDCSKYVSKDSFHDSDKDDTMSEWRESNMNASRNEESSLENSSDIVTTKPSNKKSVTESEQSTADVKGDIVVKDQVKAEGYKKDKTTLRNKSKIGARHNNKDIKYSSRKKKFGKINDKDADQILPQKSEASTDDDVSNIIKSKDDSRNTGKHDLQSTKAINRNEKPEEAIIKHDKCERNEEANKTDTVSESCEKNEETVDVSAKKSEDVNTEKTGDFNSKKTKDVNVEKAGDVNTEKIGDVNTEKTGDVDTEKTGDVNTEKTGDVNTEKTEDVNTKKIGDVNTEKTEDVNTKKIGDVNTEKIGDVNTEKTGDVNTEKTGDVNTEKTGDVNTEKTGDVNTEKTGDVNTEKTINTEKTGDVCAEKTDVNNKKTEDVNADKKETEKRDKTEETVIRNMKDAKAGHEKYERNERDMEDVKFESNERSEDSIMREADTKRYEETKIGEVNMIDAEQVLTEKQIVSTVELVGNTAEHEDVSERVSGNTEPEDVNMKDAKEQTVTEKQDMSSGNSFTNQVKRSAEGPSIHSSKKQKVSDRVREKSPRDTEIQEAKDLTAVMEGVPSKPQRKTRTRTETRRLCSTDSKESESSMPASFEGLQSSLSSEMTPNGDSSDEYDKNTSKERRVCKEKMEEKILKSPRILKSRSQRAISKKFVSSSETSSDSNDLPVSKNDSVPQLRTCMNYQPVSSAINNEETGNILVQKLGLDINAIDLYCNTTDSKIPTNRDMANMPRQRGRLTKALEAMLRERSDLDGVAKEAFDLLPFEHHNLLGIANNRERYLTNQELLVLQNICVLNPEAPDVDMFYQILIQVLLARRRVLMVPNSLALLVVTEKIRREFNRAKRKGNHSEYLAQDWDPCKIYTTEDFWIAEKKPPKVPTVRTVLSIFCLWKNMEKRVPISLPIALEELCRNLVLWDVDKIGICVKLYSRYCTFLYEEKNPSLTEIFLNQPFVGSKTKLQKKLLYSKEDSSKEHTENLSLKHNKNVIENDVQALLKQCLEAEQAALHSSNPSEEEWFRKCVQALKAKVDLYKKDIQLIQKVTKDTEKKKFQLLSNLNSSEYEDLPQDLGKTTETLYRLLAKITTKFEMIKEAECMAAKETNKVPRLSSSALKAADLGEDISENMKDLVYELLLNKVGVEEMRPVLCSIVENMTDKNISVVPSNSWIRNFARITGLKVRSRSSVV